MDNNGTDKAEGDMASRDGRRIGDNRPLTDDHDMLTATVETVRTLVEEVGHLRDWRHDSVAPVMMVLQGQQKHTDEQAIRFETKLDRLIETTTPLLALPMDFRQHVQDDHASLRALNSAVEGLSAKIDGNRAARAEGESRIVKWVAGIVFSVGAVVIAAFWAILSQHFTWPVH